MISVDREQSRDLATPEQIEKQLNAVASAKSAVELVEAQYQLFRMVWRLPINKDKRKLTKSYLWPNIREWRKHYKLDIQSLRCYVITMNNTFKHLKTGQKNA